jgi:hypothetical protein
MRFSQLPRPNHELLGHLVLVDVIRQLPLGQHVPYCHEQLTGNGYIGLVLADALG